MIVSIPILNKSPLPTHITEVLGFKWHMGAILPPLTPGTNFSPSVHRTALPDHPTGSGSKFFAQNVRN